MKTVYRILMVFSLVISTQNAEAREGGNTKITEKQLFGQWHVINITFDNKPINTDNPFTSHHMHQGIVRYDFKTNKEFTYIVPNKKKNRPEDGRYWTWSFDEETQVFTIDQIDPTSPPFNFGFSATITNVIDKKDYTELILKVKFHDNITATITINNLKDDNWDKAPSISYKNE